MCPDLSYCRQTTQRSLPNCSGNYENFASVLYLPISFFLFLKFCRIPRFSSWMHMEKSLQHCAGDKRYHSLIVQSYYQRFESEKSMQILCSRRRQHAPKNSYIPLRDWSTLISSISVHLFTSRIRSNIIMSDSVVLDASLPWSHGNGIPRSEAIRECRSCGSQQVISMITWEDLSWGYKTAHILHWLFNNHAVQ